MTDLAIEVDTVPPPLTRDLSVVASAPAAALLVWLAWTQVAGVGLRAESHGTTQTVGAPAVVASALLFSLLGCALLRVLERRTARGLRTWTWIGGGVLVVSLLGTLGATSPAAGLGLASMHATVALVLLVGLRRVRTGAGASGATPATSQEAR